MQSVVRAVQENTCFSFPLNTDTSKLPDIAIRIDGSVSTHARPVRPAGNVVEIKDAFDVKGNMPTAFREGQRAAGSTIFGRVDDATLFQIHN